MDKKLNIKESQIVQAIGTLKVIKVTAVNDSIHYDCDVFGLLTANIIDSMLLPLYFVWDQYYKKNLDLVYFEPYLKQAYHTFNQQPQKIISTLIRAIVYEKPFEGYAKADKLTSSLLTIYIQLLFFLKN